MSTQLSERPTGRGPLRLALGGCVLLVLCAAALGAIGAGLWWFSRRGAVEPTVEYVVDASPRMALPAEGGLSSRLVVARAVLAEIVRPADPKVTAGLRVFGTGAAAEVCQDSNLIVPLAAANQARIAGQLSGLDAGSRAEAPLAEALLQAIRDLSATNGPHTLVAITGGADSCQPEAGLLIAREAERTGIKLETFVIGFQVLPDEAEAVKGMVDSLPGAHYLPARDQDQLRAILAAIQAYIDAAGAQAASDAIATAQAAGTAPATATALASPTAGVSDTAVPGRLTPAATASGAVTPEATGAGAVTPEATGASARQTACDHPYLPLRAGASWTYSGRSGGASITVSSVEGDLERATATLNKVVQGITDITTVTCGPDGLISDSVLGDFVGLSRQYEFGPGWDRTASTGVWLLPEGQLVPGAAWSVHSAFANSQGRTFTSDQELTAVGVELILLDGQAVEALRVDTTFVYGPNLDTAGNVSSWFVRGIGLVKWEAEITTSGVTGSNNLDLESYTAP